jgi:hypothetical protein
VLHCERTSLLTRAGRWLAIISPHRQRLLREPEKKYRIDHQRQSQDPSLCRYPPIAGEPHRDNGG